MASNSNPNGHGPNGIFNISNSESILESLKSYLASGNEEIQGLKAALKNKDDEIQRLSTKVLKLEEKLIEVEKRGASKAEQKMNQVGKFIRASVDLAFGEGRDANFNWEGMIAAGVVPEEKLKEMKTSQSPGTPSSNSTESDSSEHNESASEEEEMDAGNESDLNLEADESSFPSVTWNSISPEDQKKVEETLEKRYLNDEKVKQNLEGPNLVKLINGTMPSQEDLFQGIVRAQFLKYKAENGKPGLRENEVWSIFAKLALDKVFPECSESLSGQFNFKPNWRDEITKLGIVEVKDSGDPEFFHSSLKEVCIARWLVDKLTKEKSWNKEMDTFLIHTVLETYLYECYSDDCQQDQYNSDYSDYKDSDDEDNPSSEDDKDDSSSEDDKDDSSGEDGIGWNRKDSYEEQGPKCYKFLNYFCNVLNSVIGEHSGTVKGHPIDFTDVSDEKRIRAIGRACAHHGFSNILKLIADLGTYEDYAMSSLLFCTPAIAVAARKIDLGFFKIANASFKNNCWMDDNLKVKALKNAAGRGELPAVEYLLNEMGLRDLLIKPNKAVMGVIPSITDFSENNSDDLIEKKISILQLIDSVNPALKNESSTGDSRYGGDQTGPPLVGIEAHHQLLIELLRLGADVHSVDGHGDTVLHHNVYSGVFESLLNTIPQRDLQKLVHVKGYLEDTPLLRAIRCSVPTRQILEKLIEAGADIYAVDNEGYSAIGLAIKTKEGCAIVSLLMDFYAGVAWRGRKQETLLHLAAAQHNADVIELLLKAKIDPNCKDAAGLTPLDHVINSEKSSSESSFTKAAGILQSAGGKLSNTVDEQGQTLLHRKAKNGDAYVLALLIKLGLNVNDVDKDGNTALHLAMEGGWWYEHRKVELLLQNRANPNALNNLGNTPLHIGLKNKGFSIKSFQFFISRTSSFQFSESMIVPALEFVFSRCKDYSMEKMRNMLEYLKLCRKDFFHSRDHSGNTIHHLATIQGNKSMLIFFMSEGLHIDGRNKLLQTPLHVTANFSDKADSIKMAKFLIENGADTSLRDGEDYTFLHRFIMDKNVELADFEEIVEYLLLRDSISLFNIPGGPNGSTPLQEAVKLLQMSEEMLISMTSQGADVNVKDKHGDSVLSYAVQGQTEEKFLSKLNDMGLEWNHTNFEGHNLLHIASLAGNWQVIDYLMEIGINPNWVDSKGNTPLHSLMQNGKKNILGIARRLVGKGVDVASTNWEGLTPLEIGLKREDGFMSEELKKVLI